MSASLIEGGLYKCMWSSSTCPGSRVAVARRCSGCGSWERDRCMCPVTPPPLPATSVLPLDSGWTLELGSCASICSR